LTNGYNIEEKYQENLKNGKRAELNTCSLKIQEMEYFNNRFILVTYFLFRLKDNRSCNESFIQH